MQMMLPCDVGVTQDMFGWRVKKVAAEHGFPQAAPAMKRLMRSWFELV